MNNYVGKAIASAIFENEDWNYNFWVSIGADPTKKWTKTYCKKLLADDYKKSFDKNGNPAGKLKEEIESMQARSAERVAKMSAENKEKLKKYSPSNFDFGKSIVYQYPPQLQKTLNSYIESMEVPIDAVPDPSRKTDVERYGWWCQDLEKIRNHGGEHLVDAMVRTKRNFNNRHNQGWDISNHPWSIGKIFLSALEEIKIEADTIFEPKKVEVSEDKEHISSLRGIFD